MLSFSALLYYASIHYFPSQARLLAARAKYYIYGTDNLKLR